MTTKTEIWQGTLALMILKTLDTLGPLHGYGIARRIEQTSGDLISLNYGTLYPSLLKLEQEGFPKTTARQSTTSSHAQAANNSNAKPKSGTKRPQSSRASSRPWRSSHEKTARLVVET